MNFLDDPMPWMTSPRQTTDKVAYANAYDTYKRPMSAFSKFLIALAALLLLCAYALTVQ